MRSSLRRRIEDVDQWCMSNEKRLRRLRVLIMAACALQVGGASALAMEVRASDHVDAGAPAAMTPSTTAPAADALLSSAAVGDAVSATPPPPAPPALPPPAPAPPPPPAPPPRTPAPPPAVPVPPTPRDPLARVHASFETAVPAAWRAAIAVRFVIIEGSTSWAVSDGTIEVARTHASGAEAQLRALLAHEFGHLIAYRYGSQAFDGAAPDGWPPYSARPEEAWADCVSRAFTTIDDPSHGLPSCGGDSLSWTSGWLGAGPAARQPTG